MSLGYVKGKFWHPDERYARYANSDSYKALLRAMRPAGFTFNCEYSYTAQRYTAEIITIEKFAGSGNYYTLKHNNAYHANPMAAVCMAIRESERATPLVRAACLVIECELLAEAVAEARGREYRLERVLDSLRSILDSIPVTFMQGDEVISVAKIGELRGRPFKSILPFPDDDWHGDIPLGQARPLPADPDEDDDL